MADFHTKKRVEFGDTDMAGIVHFSNFFRYMEMAECDFLRAAGLSVKMEWEGMAIGFPRVSATCDYVNPARFEDVLDIAVRVDRLGTKSVTYAFEFTRAGVRVAVGKVTSVCCLVRDDDSIASIEIPAGYRARLTAPREAQGEVLRTPG
jgi:YbgC/YbaW family acyl-CoA thioester hydrolase